MSDKLDKVILAAVQLAEVCPPEITQTIDGSETILLSADSGHVLEIIRRFRALRDAVNAVALLPGEPIFCMRGKDRSAPAAVLRWRTEAEAIGAVESTLNEAREKYNSFIDWQDANFRHVKVPT